jgi:hypothetical protein
MKYPIIEQVNAADRLQICEWYRFLSSPIDKEQLAILDAIVIKFKEFHGFTPAISKAIGWDPK